MANTYDRGSRVRVFGTFTSTGGTNADPTQVRLKYRKPGSTMTTWTWSTGGSTNITRIAAGQFRADIDADKEGDWLYQWDSSGAVTASGEKLFRVRPGLV